MAEISRETKYDAKSGKTITKKTLKDENTETVYIYHTEKGGTERLVSVEKKDLK